MRKTYNPYSAEAFPQSYPPDFQSNGNLPAEPGISEADFLAAAVVSNSALVPFAGTGDEIAEHVYDLVEALVRERLRRARRFAKEGK